MFHSSWVCWSSCWEPLSCSGRWPNAIGQPAVLGELMAGVVLGMSVVGLVDPKNEVLHLLAELGVVILLFEIGLETDLRQALAGRRGRRRWSPSSASSCRSLSGYGVCRLLGLGNLVAIVAGATLTATSVGITARVLSDLDRLQEPESQIILGAAVIDDVIGLVILAVVAGLTQGQEVTILGVAKIDRQSPSVSSPGRCWSAGSSCRRWFAR